MLTRELIEKAAEKFIGSQQETNIAALGNGLINQTYKVDYPARQQKIVLQAINKSVFTHPEDVVSNYHEIYDYLQAHNTGITIPAPLKSTNGDLLWIDEAGNEWRATIFVDHSYSPMNAVNEEAAYTVARSFAGFTKSLAGLDISKLKEIIKGFHNLSLRYLQFEEAIKKAPAERLLKSTHIIAELRQRKPFVDFYDSIKNNAAYPYRVMHHDCKISNILFDAGTEKVICPVDLDTTMPGKFFSDLGDMIRTMSCTVDENSTSWEDIAIRPSFYRSIVQGYLEAAGDIFTTEEKTNIHYAGLLLTYMQALRFTTDFLNEDIYYKTNYPEQNLNRALNQLILLERLEIFLEAVYSFSY